MATAEDDLLQSLDSFSAEEFEQVVLVNASKHKRNPVLTENLTGLGGDAFMIMSDRNGKIGRAHV